VLQGGNGCKGKKLYVCVRTRGILRLLSSEIRLADIAQGLSNKKGDLRLDIIEKMITFASKFK